MKLEARALGVTHPGGVTALDGVDLRVEAGEFVAVVGPSGCGKSTLLALLAGLIAPTRGEILLDGARPPSLLGRAAYMPQRDCLMPWRTVLDNCAVGLELRGARRREARAAARAELERFGLLGFEDRRPGDLSGGMRQRAALLRTLLAGRDVMLLDEPFAALDALTRAGLQDWLLGIAAATDTTIVLVTHDVTEAAYLADRVYVLTGRPGRVALEVDVPLPRPRHRELQASPGFAELRETLLGPLVGAGDG
jgi:ABC-type nitrate/sulfonate/bicarbonate transport system ATPase subunit